MSITPHAACALLRYPNLLHVWGLNCLSRRIQCSPLGGACSAGAPTLLGQAGERPFQACGLRHPPRLFSPAIGARRQPERNGGPPDVASGVPPAGLCSGSMQAPTVPEPPTPAPGHPGPCTKASGSPRRPVRPRSPAENLARVSGGNQLPLRCSAGNNRGCWPLTSPPQRRLCSTHTRSTARGTQTHREGPGEVSAVGD